MFIRHTSPSVRLTGRWDISNPQCAVTTAPGAYAEIAFKGKDAVLLFDTDGNHSNFPHIFIQLDNGAKMEAPIDRFMRIEANTSCEHTLKFIFKSCVESQHRWYQPLINKISFLGIEADTEGVLAPDTRRTIEFIGDSITEGVLIDDRNVEKDPFQNRVYQDDSTATYAWLTAEKLNLRPFIMGYGAVGILKSGQGSVPKVIESYPYNFCNSPATPPQADIIVINHGANDAGFRDAERYTSGYREFLDLVRDRNPKSKIVVLAAFCGAYCKELGQMVAEYNSEKQENVLFIDTTGWIPLEPLHPLRDGHKIIAEHLAEKLAGL